MSRPKPITITPAFSLMEKVWHRADGQTAGLVTRFHVSPNGILYGVTWGGDASDSCHYAEELTTEKPVSWLNKEETED